MGFGVLKMLVKNTSGQVLPDLTVDEAATLAGMLKGPEIYNLSIIFQNATNRRNTVLAPI